MFIYTCMWGKKNTTAYNAPFGKTIQLDSIKPKLWKCNSISVNNFCNSVVVLKQLTKFPCSIRSLTLIRKLQHFCLHNSVSIYAIQSIVIPNEKLILKLCDSQFCSNNKDIEHYEMSKLRNLSTQAFLSFSVSVGACLHIC